MPTISIRPRQVKPLAPVPEPQVAWVHRPIWPCELLPSGLPGLLILNGTVYMVHVAGELPKRGPAIVHGYKLIKATGQVYDLPADLSACDCGDGTFREERPQGCKHRRGLQQALEAIGYAVPGQKPANPAWTREELQDAAETHDAKWGSEPVSYEELTYEPCYADADVA